MDLASYASEATSLRVCSGPPRTGPGSEFPDIASDTLSTPSGKQCYPFVEHVGVDVLVVSLVEELDGDLVINGKHGFISRLPFCLLGMCRPRAAHMAWRGHQPVADQRGSGRLPRGRGGRQLSATADVKNLSGDETCL